MAFHFDKKRFRLYVWIGLAFTLLWMFDGPFEPPETPLIRLVNNAWRAAYIVCANYFFFDHLLPRLSRKKVFRSLAILALQFFVYTFGLYAWRGAGILLHIWTPLVTYDSLRDGVCANFPYSIISAFFFGVIVHIHDHIELRQTAQQLRIEKQEAELNFLKAQTNPHFLFNTLNNIFALAQEKSDLAPESILKLSAILRFMLYKSGESFLPIEQEIKVIQDYIHLEKLRYDESLRVQFDYKIRDPQQRLPPLLLIPLVENAFKHGASEAREQSYVDIRLMADERRLFFEVKNSTETHEEARVLKENIGLSNLRRQLELLYREFDLSLAQGTSEFTATLQINLASHV